MYFFYPLQAIFCQKSIVKTTIKQKKHPFISIIDFFCNNNKICKNSIVLFKFIQQKQKEQTLLLALYV